ncbi:MAG: hypothetical protein J0L53_12520 [Spirochaetes bacterium]|nr:hypothetical protein [Spirochaetota bacterium]
MRPLVFIRLVTAALLLFSGAALLTQAKPAEETYPVRIILEPRPDAKFYQVEWLEKNEVEGQNAAPADESLKEKITKTEIRRNLPVRFKYFRLRSAYRDGLYGPWGDVVEIQRPVKITQKTDKTEKTEKPPEKKPGDDQDTFVRVIDKNGKEKWVLKGSAVNAAKLAKNDPLFYDVESLTNPEAEENTKGRKKYESPVPFTNAGQYKMNLYAGEDPALQPLQTWLFSVYTDVPRTYVKFFAPFLHGKGGFTVGGKTKIALLPQFSQVATDKIEYRVYKDGVTPGAWVKYEDEIEVNSFAKGQYGYFNVEFQQTNVAGITEVPQHRRMLIDATGPVIEEVKGAEGGLQLSFKDENFPIVVRVYQAGKLIEDKYYKFWNARDTFKLPAAGVEIKAIDLLGNETILKK